MSKMSTSAANVRSIISSAIKRLLALISLVIGIIVVLFAVSGDFRQFVSELVNFSILDIAQTIPAVFGGFLFAVIGFEVLHQLRHVWREDNWLNFNGESRRRLPVKLALFVWPRNLIAFADPWRFLIVMICMFLFVPWVYRDPGTDWQVRWELFAPMIILTLEAMELSLRALSPQWWGHLLTVFEAVEWVAIRGKNLVVSRILPIIKSQMNRKPSRPRKQQIKKQDLHREEEPQNPPPTEHKPEVRREEPKVVKPQQPPVTPKPAQPVMTKPVTDDDEDDFLAGLAPKQFGKTPTVKQISAHLSKVAKELPDGTNAYEHFQSLLKGAGLDAGWAGGLKSASNGENSRTEKLEGYMSDMNPAQMQKFLSAIGYNS